MGLAKETATAFLSPSSSVLAEGNTMTAEGDRSKTTKSIVCLAGWSTCMTDPIVEPRILVIDVPQ